MHNVNKGTGFAPKKDDVTNWYCDMFLPKKDPISQLANAAGIRSSIINYDQSMSQDDAVLFEQAFKKIASNPVGRMLLYRLLVEIYRHDGAGRGVPEFQVQKGETRLRNDSRQIKIKMNVNESTLWSYVFLGNDSYITAGPDVTCRSINTNLLDEKFKIYAKQLCNVSIIPVLDSKKSLD